MTSYTKEQIEAAFDSATGDFSVNLKRDVIAALQKPKWKPQVGEVYCYDINYHRVCEKGRFPNEDPTVRRPLTPSEVPALALAIERLERLGSGEMFRDSCRSHTVLEAQSAEIKATIEYGRQSLADIKALT